jgi:hypothetical protein
LETASTGVSSVHVPPVRLSSAQWELLHRYLNRRDQLDPEARERLAHSIHQSLKSVVRGTDLELSPLSSTAWLMELARRT